MGRVAHQKPGKQAASNGSLRSTKAVKQRKNHKIVVESTNKDKEKSRNVLSFKADPPEGYTFIPAGNPELTAAMKEFAKRGNREVFAVTATPHASRHELSREVHRVGFHFPSEVVNEVCAYYGIQLTPGGKLKTEKDDDQLFMRVYQKGQLVLNEGVRDQVTINTEAKQIIKDLFPNIPDNDLYQIIKTAFQLGDGKVGTADEIPLVRRAQLSVVAHIRHTYTNYDKLLRQVQYSEARHRVENETLKKLVEWRGDDEDKQAVDDTIREVVVISDEESEDDELEEGQVLENSDLRVQPVSSRARPVHVSAGQATRPIEVYSDDEVQNGVRYVSQIPRRPTVPNHANSIVSRQQSRYARWEQVRQEFRSAAPPRPALQVIARVPIDDARVSHGQQSKSSHVPIYVQEQAPQRIMEPPARIPQPGPTYVRGDDGRLYEKICVPDSYQDAIPQRRARTPPPTEYIRQHTDVRAATPRVYSLATHRRTESIDDSDFNVLPSIEDPSGSYPSPGPRRNPFDESQRQNYKRHSGVQEHDYRRILRLEPEDQAQDSPKRRRFEDSPVSPFVRTHEQRMVEEPAVGRPYISERMYEPRRHVFEVPHPSYSLASQTVAHTTTSADQYRRVLRDAHLANDSTHHGREEDYRSADSAMARPIRTLPSNHDPRDIYAQQGLRFHEEPLRDQLHSGYLQGHPEHRNASVRYEPVTQKITNYDYARQIPVIEADHLRSQHVKYIQYEGQRSLNTHDPMAVDQPREDVDVSRPTYSSDPSRAFRPVQTPAATRSHQDTRAELQSNQVYRYDSNTQDMSGSVPAKSERALTYARGAPHVRTTYVHN